MARRSTPAAVAAQPDPAPEAGHNSEYLSWTDEQLVAKKHEVDDQLKAAQKKLDEWAKPFKQQLNDVKQTVFARLVERGNNSVSTDAGTAYLSTIMNLKIEDATKLFDFFADNWDEFGADILLNITKEAVKRFMETNHGMTPPGVKVSYFQQININRS